MVDFNKENIMSQIRPDFTYFPPLKTFEGWMDCPPMRRLPSLQGWLQSSFDGDNSLGELMRRLGSISYDFSNIPVNKYVNEDKEVYEFLVPGIPKENLTVSKDKNLLTVTVKENKTLPEGKLTVNQHKVLSNKTHTLVLDSNSAIGPVTLKDGVLTVEVTTHKPQPQLLEIK